MSLLQNYNSTSNFNELSLADLHLLMSEFGMCTFETYSQHIKSMLFADILEQVESFKKKYPGVENISLDATEYEYDIVNIIADYYYTQEECIEKIISAYKELEKKNLVKREAKLKQFNKLKEELGL